MLFSYLGGGVTFGTTENSFDSTIGQDICKRLYAYIQRFLKLRQFENPLSFITSNDINTSEILLNTANVIHILGEKIFRCHFPIKLQCRNSFTNMGKAKTQQDV